MARSFAAYVIISAAVVMMDSMAWAGEDPDATALRRAVIDAAGRGAPIRFYVDLMGNPVRARLLKADEDGIEVSVGGSTMSMAWSQLSPPRFAGLAGKAVADDAALALALARYCATRGLTREAEDALELARSAGAGSADIRAVSESVRPSAENGSAAAEGRTAAENPSRAGGEHLVDIHVEDHSGTARKAWPVTGGVPLPKGKARDATKIGLSNAPCQTRVLSRWSDGSVKWALLDFQTDLAGGGMAKHSVVVHSRAPSAPGNRVNDNGGTITVDTGILKFSVSKTGFQFLSAVWLDVNGNGQYESAEQVVRPNSGQDHFYDLQANNPERPTLPYSARNLLKGTSREVNAAKPTVPGGPRWIRPEGGGAGTRVGAAAGHYSAGIIEHGPLRTVVQLKGTLGTGPDADEYTIRVHAYKGKPFLRVRHTFVFKGDPQKTNIRRMGMVLPLDFPTPPEFTAAGMSGSIQPGADDTVWLYCTGPHDVFHLEHLAFPLDWQVGHGDSVLRKGTDKTAGWLDVTGEDFGVTASFRDMAYKYPKEVSYDARTRSLIAWLWPDHGNLVLDLRASSSPDGMQGISFTHDVFYWFHAPGGERGSTGMAAGFDDPLRPYADPEWYSYRGTRAAGMIMPRDDRQFPRTEAVLAARTCFLERSMAEWGWLGMLNYGDLMWAYKYNEHSGLGTWGMGERSDDYGGWRHGNTMISYRMFMQYLRTGEYNYRRAAEAHLEFVRDVLVKHYSSEHPAYNGLGRRHSAYWGAPGNAYPGGTAIDGYGSNWLGHYIHWNLTGDWRTYEVLGELRAAWNRLGNSAIHETSGGAYVGLKLLGGIPGYEEAAREADNFLKTAVERTSRPQDYWRDCTWFFGYGLYLADVGDEPIRKAILDFWKNARHAGDQYGMYWQRDSTAAVYWAAEGHPDVRKAAYEELVKYGSCETARDRRIPAQLALYRQYGVSGLFRCDMKTLEQAVAPGYWRAKDDIQQLQWDEPLSMAVIDHFRSGRR